MAVYMWVTLGMVNHMGRVVWIITLHNLTILNITKVNGKMVYQMAMVTHITIMEMFIKEIFTTDNVKDLGHMYLIKFTDMKASGEIIHFQVRANSSEMGNSFLKDNSKMD